MEEARVDSRRVIPVSNEVKRRTTHSFTGSLRARGSQLDDGGQPWCSRTGASSGAGRERVSRLTPASELDRLFGGGDGEAREALSAFRFERPRHRDGSVAIGVGLDDCEDLRRRYAPGEAAEVAL
jgi:hypothetical protein